MSLSTLLYIFFFRVQLALLIMVLFLLYVKWLCNHYKIEYSCFTFQMTFVRKGGDIFQKAAIAALIPFLSSLIISPSNFEQDHGW